MKSFLYLLVAASTMCTLVAQLLLKRVVGTPEARLAMQGGLPDFVMHAASNPWAWLALSIQVSGYVIWLVVLSKEKMAVAFAISGSFFYLVVGLAGWVFYAERLSATQWLGICFISMGVLLIAYRS
ncbi:undecaprenyl phosphate-alpha-L-ara4N flippase subunit ArnE [Xanthomonas arboricola]|uniref:hypothetical protein n=1 Tax=Xanthomonas arboricola TaxID=56448 RepID=UPI00142FD3CA|nr:hypothetical protein [Xanthomonas arboricola]NJC31339.1 undecaprenyl phosphate-alpha-L-ara4N flippase subunit ArnE [Xanthomonas arboricola]